MSLEQAQVGGHHVPRLELHDVAGHELRRWNHDAASASDDAGFGSRHSVERLDRALSAELLRRADDGVERNDDDDRHRIAGLA